MLLSEANKEENNKANNEDDSYYNPRDFTDEMIECIRLDILD